MSGLRLVQRLDLIDEICSGKRVLHLGCTNYPYTQDSIRDGMLLHSRLGEIASELFGFDADEAGLKILQESGFDKLFKADLENLNELDIDEKFDVILAGEIIEHLNNPGLFLRGIRRFMDDSTKLVITTVNAYCAMRTFQYAVSRSRGKNEPVHPDHVAYYSCSTLRVLIERHGLSVDAFYFYDLGREHRPHATLAQKVVNDVAVRVAPQLADGVIAIAKLSSNRNTSSGSHENHQHNAFAPGA